MRTVTIEIAETETGLIATLTAHPPITWDGGTTELEHIASSVAHLLVDYGVNCLAAPAPPPEAQP